MANYFDLPPLDTDEEKPGTRDYAILEWCDTRMKRGVDFLESQMGYDKIDHALSELFSYEKTSMALSLIHI